MGFIVAGCCRSASKISTKWFGIKLATIFTKFLLLQKLYFHKTLDGFITGWQKNWLTVCERNLPVVEDSNLFDWYDQTWRLLLLLFRGQAEIDVVDDIAKH